MTKIYPEHEKMSKIVDHSQKIGEFLGWLGDVKEYRICEYCEYMEEIETTTSIIEGRNPPEYYTRTWTELSPIMKDTNKLLAEFFDIDLDKIEQEKREMLEDIRKANSINGS